jgi:hypothetical protein
MVVRASRTAGALFALVVACGGESRSHGDASAGMPAGGAPEVAGGAGSGWVLPTKDGIPIGDCTEPSASELTRDGCPASEADGVACDAAQNGDVCRYAIETEPEFMSAFQGYAVCLDGRWVPGDQRCSDTCHSASTGIETVRFDTSDCSTRPRLACARVDPTVVPRPSAQNSMDDELEALVQGCSPSAWYAEVDFENGCPTELITSSSIDPSVVACLVSKLTGVRYDCAVPIPCSSWSAIAI